MTCFSLNLTFMKINVYRGSFHKTRFRNLSSFCQLTNSFIKAELNMKL